MRTYSKTQKYSIAHNFFNVDHNIGMLHFKMIVLMRGIQLNKNCSHLSYPFSQKLNIMKLLFFSPSEIFSPKPVLGACSYAVSNSGSHTYEQTQRNVHLVLIVAFQCLLVYIQ